jgi:hypothetical protein
MHIIVRPRSTRTKTAPLPLDLPDSATVRDLQKQITSAWRLSASRQRLTLDNESKTVLEDEDKSLKEYGVSNKTNVLVKDLGAQIGALRLGDLLALSKPWLTGWRTMVRSRSACARRCGPHSRSAVSHRICASVLG